MSQNVWIVGYERGGVVGGPFKVFADETKAREFVRWCGDASRIVVGAEMDVLPKAPPVDPTDWHARVMQYSGDPHRNVSLDNLYLANSASSFFGSLGNGLLPGLFG